MKFEEWFSKQNFCQLEDPLYVARLAWRAANNQNCQASSKDEDDLYSKISPRPVIPDARPGSRVMRKY